MMREEEGGSVDVRTSFVTSGKIGSVGSRLTADGASDATSMEDNAAGADGRVGTATGRAGAGRAGGGSEEIAAGADP